MAKGKGFLDTVLSGVRMNDDDFYEEEEFDEEEDGEEEDDESGFIDSGKGSRPRFNFSFGTKKTPRTSRVSKSADVEAEKEDSYSSYEEDEEPEDTYEEPKPQKESPFASAPTRNTKKSSKVTPLRRTHNQSYSSEVRVLHPLDMEQASAIGDALLDEAVVVLNLEGLDLDLAQRIIDFSSGCIYALGANLHKVTEYFFVIAPSSIEITGDMKSIMRGAAPSVRAEY